MTASRFINFDPTGSSPLDIAYRNLGRHLPLNHRFNLRGVKDTKDTKYGQADGRFPYLNEETCMTLTAAQVAFILGHEDYHLLLNHIQRMRKFEGAMMHWRGQNWSAANVGCDLIINPRLIKDNEAARGKMVKEGKTPYDIIKPLGDILIDIPELYDTREFIQCEETGVWKTNPDKEDLSSEELVAKLARLFPVPPVPINSSPSGDQSDEDGDEQQQGDVHVAGAAAVQLLGNIARHRVDLRLVRALRRLLPPMPRLALGLGERAVVKRRADL